MCEREKDRVRKREKSACEMVRERKRMCVCVCAQDIKNRIRLLGKVLAVIKTSNVSYL